jgi:RimJ/RimL family protein N-acetyltransferase
MASAPDVVRTERLLLRRVVLEDLTRALEIMGDPETNLYNPGGPPTPFYTMIQMVEWRQRWVSDGIGYWAVELDGEVIGFGGVRTHVVDGERSLNLFYRFTPAHWGRGYATEMARAAVAWADAERPEWPVVVMTDPGNKPSRRVAEKLGFVVVGTCEGMDLHRRDGGR